MNIIDIGNMIAERGQSPTSSYNLLFIIIIHNFNEIIYVKNLR